MIPLIDFSNSIQIGFCLAGLSIGSILGFTFGYTSDHKMKNVVIGLFAGIVVAAMGGGMYYFKTETVQILFYIFTIFLGVSFGIVSLISVKRHNVVYGFSRISPKTETMIELRKYGVNFNQKDGIVFEAIAKKGLTDIGAVANYCGMKKSQAQKILNRLVKRGVPVGHF